MRGRWRKRKRSGEEAIFHRCGKSWLFDSDSHEIVVAALALGRDPRKSPHYPDSLFAPVNPTAAKRAGKLALIGKSHDFSWCRCTYVEY